MDQGISAGEQGILSADQAIFSVRQGTLWFTKQEFVWTMIFSAAVS